MQQQNPAAVISNDEDSYTSSSGSYSDTGSTAESNASESHALAGHVEASSACHHPQNVSKVGQPLVARAAAVRKRSDGDEQYASVQPSTPAKGHQAIEAAQAAAPTGPPGQPESPTEENQVLDRDEIIRRLSQSVLTLSNNTLTRITDEDSPGVSNYHDIAARQIDFPAAAGRKVSSTSPGAARERHDFEEPDNTGSANAAPNGEHESSPDRGQALTQVTHLPWPKPPCHRHSLHHCT